MPRRSLASSCGGGRAYEEKDTQVLRIGASDVAAVAGYHEWVDVRDLFLERLLYQDLGHVLERDAANLGIEVEDRRQRSERLLAKAGNEELRKVRRRARDGVAVATVQDAQALREKAHTLLNIAKGKRKLSRQEAKELESDLRYDINTQFGTRNENEAIAVYERRTGTEVICSNDRIMVWPFPGLRCGDGVPDGAIAPPLELSKGWTKKKKEEHEPFSRRKFKRCRSSATQQDDIASSPVNAYSSSSSSSVSATVRSLAQLSIRPADVAVEKSDDCKQVPVSVSLPSLLSTFHTNHQGLRCRHDDSDDGGDGGDGRGADDGATATTTTTIEKPSSNNEKGSGCTDKLDNKSPSSSSSPSSRLTPPGSRHKKDSGNGAVVRGDRSPGRGKDEKQACRRRGCSGGREMDVEPTTNSKVAGVGIVLEGRDIADQESGVSSGRSTIQGHAEAPLAEAATVAPPPENDGGLRLMADDGKVPAKPEKPAAEGRGSMTTQSPAAIVSAEERSIQTSPTKPQQENSHTESSTEQGVTVKAQQQQQEEKERAQPLPYTNCLSTSSPSLEGACLDLASKHHGCAVIGDLVGEEPNVFFTQESPLAAKSPYSCSEKKLSISSLPSPEIPSPPVANNSEIIVAAAEGQRYASESLLPRDEATTAATGSAGVAPRARVSSGCSCVLGGASGNRCCALLSGERGVVEAEKDEMIVAKLDVIGGRRGSSVVAVVGTKSSVDGDDHRSDTAAMGEGGVTAVEAVTEENTLEAESKAGGRQRCYGSESIYSAAQSQAGVSLFSEKGKAEEDGKGAKTGRSSDAALLWPSSEEGRCQRQSEARSAGSGGNDLVACDDTDYDGDDGGCPIDKSITATAEATVRGGTTAVEGGRGAALAGDVLIDEQFYYAWQEKKIDIEETVFAWGEGPGSAFSVEDQGEGSAPGSAEGGCPEVSLWRRGQQQMMMGEEDCPSGSTAVVEKTSFSARSVSTPLYHSSSDRDDVYAGGGLESCRGEERSEVEGKRSCLHWNNHQASGGRPSGDRGSRGWRMEGGRGSSDIQACFVLAGAVDGVAEEVTAAPEGEGELWETRRVVVEVKNRMHRAKHPPPLYDQIQLVTYMMMIGASVGDLVQFVKKGASGREGVRKRKGALGNRAGVNQPEHRARIEDSVAISRVELDCKVYQHRKHWFENTLPRLYAFARMVYRFRGDDLLRWRYLLAGPDEQREMLVECCPYLGAVIPQTSLLPASLPLPLPPPPPPATSPATVTVQQQPNKNTQITPPSPSPEVIVLDQESDNENEMPETHKAIFPAASNGTKGEDVTFKLSLVARAPPLTAGRVDRTFANGLVEKYVANGIVRSGGVVKRADGDDKIGTAATSMVESAPEITATSTAAATTGATVHDQGGSSDARVCFSQRLRVPSKSCFRDQDGSGKDGAVSFRGSVVSRGSANNALAAAAVLSKKSRKKNGRDDERLVFDGQSAGGVVTISTIGINVPPSKKSRRGGRGRE